MEITEKIVLGFLTKEGYGPEPRRLESISIASYRRTGPTVFTFCRSQMAIGDCGREFYQPESQGGDMSEATPETEPVEETEEEETEETEETETTEEPATTPATEPEAEF